MIFFVGIFGLSCRLTISYGKSLRSFTCVKLWINLCSSPVCTRYILFFFIETCSIVTNASHSVVVLSILWTSLLLTMNCGKSIHVYLPTLRRNVMYQFMIFHLLAPGTYCFSSLRHIVTNASHIFAVHYSQIRHHGPFSTFFI